MPLDPRIALNARASDLSQVGNNFIQGFESAQRAKLNNQNLKLGEQRLKLTEQDQEIRKERLAQAKLSRMDQREQARLKSSVIGGVRLKSYLDAEDLKGAENFLTQRRNNLMERQALGENVDTRETDEALQLLQSNPEELRSIANQSVQLGQQLGFLQTPKAQEGFTLKEGETRFNAQGQKIAEGSLKQEKAPTGFRFTEGGNKLEIIPGSPQDIEQKEVAKAKSSALKNQKAKASIVLNKIEEALDQTDNVFATGLYGQVLSNLGGTDARNLEATVNTLQANLGFDALQAMRDASPTGGALGQVSERELALLTSAVASLDIAQDSGQLKKNLLSVKKHYQNWLSTIEEAESQQGITSSANNLSVNDLDSLSEEQLLELRNQVAK